MPADTVAPPASPTLSPDRPWERRLGPFAVRADGSLIPADAAVAPSFTVRWRGRTVRASLLSEPSGDAESGSLAIQVVAGQVPSTAGAVDRPPSRERALDAIRGLRANCPAPWRLALLPDHRIALAARETLALPTSAAELVTQVTSSLLALSPYLDLLDEYGAEIPGTA